MKRNTRVTAVVAICLTATMSLAACGRSTVKASTPTEKAGAISSGKATGIRCVNGDPGATGVTLVLSPSLSIPFTGDSKQVYRVQ